MASARLGRLTTYPRGARLGSYGTTVALEGNDEGGPVVCLVPGSPAAAQLLTRRLARVRVEPDGYEPVTVQGAVRRLASSVDGLLRYRVEVAAVRLGQQGRLSLPVEEFWAARPDPLRHDAPAVVQHLSQCHGEALAACLRARGHGAVWAEARALDYRGIDVISVGLEGVELVRLPFPEPVTRLQDLPAGLAGPLLCRCRPR